MILKKTLFFLGFFGIMAYAVMVNARTYPTQICRGGACQPISFSPRPQLMDQIDTLFPSSIQQILFCEADPASRTCVRDGLEFFGYSATTNVRFNVPFARIIHVDRRQDSYGLTLDYQVMANGMYPACMVSDGALELYSKGIMQINSPYFACQMTRMGTTRIMLQFQLDYVDFATRRLGAFYTAYVEGEVTGSGSGYALLRLTPERRVVEERPVTVNPWKAAQPTPMMRTYSGNSGMPNMLDPNMMMMNNYDIRANQKDWGIRPTTTKKSGLDGWYVDNTGAYTPMGAPDTTWRGQLSNYWDKLLQIIYLDPE